MIRTSVALALLAALAPAQSGVSWWSKSWEAAWTEARERNVPLLIAFIQDGEEANERIVSGLHADPAFAKLTGMVVPIIASIAIHPPKKEEVRGTIETVCSRFGAVSCTRHKEHEMMAREQFFSNRDVTTPNHIVVLPDGKETARIHDVHPFGTYDAAVRDAQKRLGRGLPAAVFQEAHAALANLQRAVKEGRFREAFTGFQELQRNVKGTPLEPRATDLIGALEVRVKEELAALKAAEAGKDFFRALRRLAELGAELKGTPFEKELARLESSIKRTSEGREAAAILIREDRVRPRFQKAEELIAQREYLRAVQELGRVLKAVHRGPLAEQARQRLDALRKDPDILAIVQGVLQEVDADLAVDAGARLLKEDRSKGEQKLKQVIEQWPATPAAERARKLLGSGD